VGRQAGLHPTDGAGRHLSTRPDVPQWVTVPAYGDTLGVALAAEG